MTFIFEAFVTIQDDRLIDYATLDCEQYCEGADRRRCDQSVRGERDTLVETVDAVRSFCSVELWCRVVWFCLAEHRPGVQTPGRLIHLLSFFFSFS